MKNCKTLSSPVSVPTFWTDFWTFVGVNIPYVLLESDLVLAHLFTIVKSAFSLLRRMSTFHVEIHIGVHIVAHWTLLFLSCHEAVVEFDVLFYNGFQFSGFGFHKNF